MGYGGGAAGGGGEGECMFAYVLEGGVGEKVSVIAILSASGCM